MLCHISAYSGTSGSLCFKHGQEKNDEQEKESNIHVRMGKKPTLANTICHHSASLVMAISDPRDIFFLFHLNTQDRFLQ